jgi:DNA-binding response OmpR family regulator
VLPEVELTDTTQATSDHWFYRDEHLFIDLRHRVVVLDNKILNLSRMEYLVLSVLVERAGVVVPRPVLLVLTRAVDMHIRQLQRRLGEYASLYIERVVGIGYRFRPAFLPRE